MDFAEGIAAMKRLRGMLKEIDATTRAMHFALLDTGLAEPKVEPSWDVEREDFLRSLT